MPQPLVYIILVNFNGQKDTLECLHSLQQIKGQNFQTIVIDNGSKDDSISEIQKHYPNTKLIPTHQNLGFAEGNNVGIRYALAKGADYIMLLNNDTTVDPEFLTAFLFQNDDIMGPKLYTAQDKNRFDHLGGIWNPEKGHFDLIAAGEIDDGSHDEPESVDYVCGACLIAKRAVFETTGLLEPQFFLYWEESDFCARAKKLGFIIKTCPKSKVYHKVSASFTGGKPHTTYYDWRGRLLWIKRNCSTKEKRHLLRKVFIPEIAKIYRHSLLKKLQALANPEKKKQVHVLDSAKQGVKDFTYNRFGIFQKKS